MSEDGTRDVFGKYSTIRQIRVGNTNAARETVYVVYDDIFQVGFATENMNGFQVASPVCT